MSELIYQTKLVINSDLSKDDEDEEYVYIHLESMHVDEFTETFFISEYEDYRYLLKTTELMVKDIEDALQYAEEQRDVCEDKELFNKQFTKAKAEFLELVKTQKGLLLNYTWGNDGDPSKRIISLASVSPIATCLVHDCFLIREIAKASHDDN